MESGTWYFTFDKSRSIVNQQLLKQKLETEAKLNEKIVKRKDVKKTFYYRMTGNFDERKI